MNNPFVLYPSDAYPYEREDYVYIKNNLWDFFISKAMREIDFDVIDYGYEHDKETDDAYIFIDLSNGDSIMYDDQTEMFALCDTTRFVEDEKYQKAYKEFINKLKNISE